MNYPINYNTNYTVPVVVAEAPATVPTQVTEVTPNPMDKPVMVEPIPVPYTQPMNPAMEGVGAPGAVTLNPPAYNNNMVNTNNAVSTNPYNAPGECWLWILMVSSGLERIRCVPERVTVLGQPPQ